MDIPAEISNPTVLYGFLRDAVYEAGRENDMEGAPFVKCYACVVEGQMKKDEYLKIIRLEPTSILYDEIENRWDVLNEMRQSYTDSQEHLITMMRNKGVDTLIVRLMEEGRMNSTIATQLTREVIAGRVAGTLWPEEVRQQIREINLVRNHENKVGLIKQQRSRTH